MPQPRPPTDWAAVCEQVQAIVREVAREIILPRQAAVVRNHKGDGSLFTEADVTAQRELARRLPELLPCPVLGEEEMTEAEQQALLAGGGTLWCLDPVDGTTNFVAGLPFFAVSVALLEDGKARLGVVYNPAIDEMFACVRGQGATLNGEPLPLRRAAPRLRDCVAGVDFKRLPNKALGDRLATRPPYYSQRNFGCSTLEWCYVAAGRLDLYLHGGQLPWDYAAGRLMLEEAGGSVCSLTSDDFDRDPHWKRSVIAALDPTLFQHWREWIRDNL